MIKNRTRIRITWFCLIAGLLLGMWAIHKEMEGVSVSAIGLITFVAGAYIGGKTWNNNVAIKNNVDPKM